LENGVRKVDIKKGAMAGTLESGDVQVTIEPSGGEITFDLTSSVINQFGRQIKKVVLGTLENLGVKSARVVVVDNGALDYAIKARVECAVLRAAEHTDGIPWGELSK
jgi:citrate lyase subunit gamma (acyl carrier protein)